MLMVLPYMALFKTARISNAPFIINDQTYVQRLTYNKLSLNILKKLNLWSFTLLRKNTIPNLNINNKAIGRINPISFLGVHENKNVTWETPI